MTSTAKRILWLAVLFLVQIASAQQFFPLKDVRPGLRGIGRTVFQGNRIEEFQVEILGVLQNLGPKQSIVLARLSGGPLAETGVLQGMSGSPVYIDGKLLGAVALGFAFSKEPIAGIQPIESMLADATFHGPVAGQSPLAAKFFKVRTAQNAASPFSNLSDIPIPLALSGFSANTLSTFSANMRSLGFQPQEGVAAAAENSPPAAGLVQAGSMISVGLITGDMNMTADGTVTYVDGKRIYAFGHRFLDAGAIEYPFAHAEVIACIPTLNSSFKLSAAHGWAGTILSDRNTAVAGEIGRASHTVPLSIAVHSATTGDHEYHLQVVNDRLLTPFLTQTALFSTIDATEKTIGAGTLRLQGRAEFEDGLPPLILHDVFVSDSAVAQQVSSDAVVALGFVLGGGFTSVRIKSLSFSIDQVDSKRQVRLAQAWTSAHQVHAGEAVRISALLQGENGLEITRNATYRVPVGAPTGSLNFTISDAATLNFPDFAGLSQSTLRNPRRLIETINAYRNSDALYVRIWRQEPAFTVSGTLPGAELTDPPPSVMLVLADPSASAWSTATGAQTRGSGIDQLVVPITGYVVSGAKTLQVEVKD
jgi:SpoIVB peptidase S55